MVYFHLSAASYSRISFVALASPLTFVHSVLSRHFAGALVLLTLLSLSWQPALAGSSVHNSSSGCPPGEPPKCSEITGTVVTDSGKGIAGAVVLFNGAQALTSGRSGAYSLTAPVTIVKSCGTFFITAWAPGYLERRYSYTVCGLQGPFAPREWKPIPLDPATHDSLCNATMTGIQPVLPSGPHTVQISGSSKSSCTPLATVDVLRFPGGATTYFPLKVTYNGRYHFKGTIRLPGNGTYFIEMVNQRLVTMFDFPLYVGIVPNQLPDHALNPDPLNTPDPFNPTYRELKDIMLSFVNRARVAKGEAPLKNNQRIAAAAQSHADQMAKYDYYYIHPHIGLNGSTPSSRLRSFGAPSCGQVNEVIAGLFTPQYPGRIAGELTYLLLTSPTHRALLLSPSNKLEGLGIGYDPTLQSTELTVDICGN